MGVMKRVAAMTPNMEGQPFEVRLKEAIKIQNKLHKNKAELPEGIRFHDDRAKKLCS